MPVGAIGAVASVAGGLAQGSAAKKAAAAQTAAAQQELALQKQIYDETSANFDPYRTSGMTGYQAYLSEMGLADRPMIGGTAPQVESFIDGATPGTGGQYTNSPGARFTDRTYSGGTPANPGVTRYRVGDQTFAGMDEAQAYANANPTGGREFGGFQESPGYQFNLTRGMDGLNSSAAARGNLLSGANIAGAMQFNQGMANQEYNNYLNRLQGIGQQGQAAAGNQAAAGQAYASGAGNALAGIGNAQAAGAIGQGNAFAGMTNNLMGTLGYLNTQPKQSGFNSSPVPPANPFLRRA